MVNESIMGYRPVKHKPSLTDKAIGFMLISYQLYSFVPATIANGLKIVVPTLALMLCLHRNKLKIFNHTVIVWVYGFIMMSLVTFFGSVSISESAGRLLAMFSALLFLTALAQYVRNKVDILRIINYLIVGAGIYIILFIIREFGSFSSLNLAQINFTMEFNNIITPALYYVIWGMFYSENRRLMGFGALVFMFLSLISGIKKVMFFPLIFLAILLFFRNRRNAIKIIFSILLVLILGIYLYNFAMTNSTMYEIIGRRLEGFANYFTGVGRVDGSTRVRMGLISDAWNTFLMNPVKGVGLGAFREVTVYGTYAHNNYLELLASTGLIGFISFYWIYGYLIIKFMYKFIHNRVEEMDFLFISIIFTNLLHDIGTISYYRFSFLIPICLSLCYLSLTKANKTTGTCYNQMHDLNGLIVE